jgi:hypothetical protein
VRPAQQRQHRLGDRQLAGLGDVQPHRGDLTAGRGADQLVTVGFPPDPRVDVLPGGGQAQRRGPADT